MNDFNVRKHLPAIAIENNLEKYLYPYQSRKTLKYPKVTIQFSKPTPHESHAAL